MTALLCVLCGREIPPRESIGRRDACPHCGAALHSCRQCAFHEPGAYNDCHEPQAERVLDKESGNFCEYFSFVRSGSRIEAATGGAGEARARLDAMFNKK